MNKNSRIKLPIYCIGDSHASFFAGINRVQYAWPHKSNNFLPFFKAFNLGQVLAYNLVKLNTKSKGRENLFRLLKQEVPKRSSVMLCFGEIDCRAHLLKQSRLQKRSINSIVSECVNRYLSAALEVKKLGYDLLIYNVIPSTRSNNINNKLYPVIGSCRERNIITSVFNKNLQLKCKSSGIPFISTYEYFISEPGLTNMLFYMDGIHLSQKALPVILKAVAKELEGDFKLSPYLFLKYKTTNLFTDSFNSLKKLKISF